MNISVIIPSYNRAHLLKRTLESVVKQDIQSLEIIVVDDASTDRTSETMRELAVLWPTVSIRYIRHEKNKGEAGARNTGIDVAVGQYIAFLDSDDEWLPGKLQKQLAAIEHQGVDGILCEYYEIEEHLKKTHIVFDVERLSAKRILTVGCNFGVGTNLLVKRSAIKQKFDENLKLFVDIDWVYRILKEITLGVLHEPLSMYYKAPMRSGDHVGHHATIFLEKYRQEIHSFSLWDRLRFYSTVNWYIAIAYDRNQEFKKALPYFMLGLCQNPFRRLGNYYYILQLFIRYGLLSKLKKESD